LSQLNANASVGPMANDRTLFFGALFYWSIQQIQEATILIKKALELTESSRTQLLASVRAVSGWIEFDESKNPMKALTLFEKSLEQEPINLMVLISALAICYTSF
jgi:tetratricopeptide (TPR) repeat protein